ncbi:low-density lipoprotein receptor class A domain-containing protein 4-like isoform X2 [Ornithodoros turicata]|uniref:low-density lipoprotein receptor class A domain-containing protein 4-like isoform X2 n=1 Tax=Ornithodoros turicata TaxID=34597 RepID=UPI003138C7BD
MLFCFGLIVLLLYETALANASSPCNATLRAGPAHLEWRASESDTGVCAFLIAAPSVRLAVRVALSKLQGPSELRLVDGPTTTALCATDSVSTGVQLPQVLVFHGPRLRIEFLPGGPDAAFAADFSFVPAVIGGCEFQCGEGGACLPDRNQVCDGQPDCPDAQDELHCPPIRRHVAGSQIVIGAIGAVLSLGVVACIVSHYKMGARSWSERRSRAADPQRYQQVLLPPAAPAVQSALYTAASAAERQRAALAAARDAQVRAASVRTDLALELPPSVAALPEEHPLAGSLHLRDADQEQELYGACVRAPPNRTVLDSNPPCRSSSVSLLHRPPILPQATPLVIRSNSVSVGGHCNRAASWHSTDCERPAL